MVDLYNLRNDRIISKSKIMHNFETLLTSYSSMVSAYINLESSFASLTTAWDAIRTDIEIADIYAMFKYNDLVITSSTTLLANKNCFTCGPISIQSGTTITVPTGTTWTVI